MKVVSVYDRDVFLISVVPKIKILQAVRISIAFVKIFGVNFTSAINKPFFTRIFLSIETVRVIVYPIPSLICPEIDLSGMIDVKSSMCDSNLINLGVFMEAQTFEKKNLKNLSRHSFPAAL